MKILSPPSRTSALRKASAALLLAAFGATCALADIVYVTSLPQNCTTTSACGAVQTDGTYTEVNITLGVTGIKGTAVGRPITLTDSRAYLSGITFTDTTSAARSLGEGMEETLTVHRLHVPMKLRKTMASTNVIESAFSKGGANDWRKVVRHFGTLARRL